MVRAMPEKGETRSLPQRPKSQSAGRAACLFLEVESGRPLAGPARYFLDGVTRILVERGDARWAVVHEGELLVQVPDYAISSRHAEIRREGAGWRLKDLGSRNGTFVDSKRVEEQVLPDRALVQLGGTFFTFHSALQRSQPALLDSSEMTASSTGLRTFSPAMQQVLHRLEATATSRVPVLLQGETGTGKELLARAIHALSARSGAFVAVNCGAIPPNLVEAELFGYRKGAFTGANRDHPGLVRASSGGTLFLDEIGDLPLQAQAALLRVLQESEVLQVGTVKPQALDLRVVAATHRDLEQLVQDKQFRLDLLGRLEGITLEIPPLRDRREDVALLVATLLARLSPEKAVSISPAAAEALLTYDWPLNVRELEHALSSALALSRGEAVETEHLPRAVVAGPRAPAELTREEAAHRGELLELLREHRGNLSAVARVVGKGRTQVRRWVSRYGFHLASFRRR